MKIKTLALRNFRSYEELKLDISPGINLLVGENAQGKTNILESIFYTALARSHRTSDDKDMVKKGSREASVDIVLDRLGVESNISFHIYKSGVSRRKIIANGVPVTLRQHVGSVNIVCFSPEDLYLVKGAPAGRRKFLDAELSQASAAYFHDFDEYIKILNQRNSLLKSIKEKMMGFSDEDDTSIEGYYPYDEAPQPAAFGSSYDDMLEVWDRNLADRAARVVIRRINAIKRLDRVAGEIANRLTAGADVLDIEYEQANLKQDDIGRIMMSEAMEIVSGSNEDVFNDLVIKSIAEGYLAELRLRRKKDIYRGSTSIGPHRDDIKISVNGLDLRSYGSQGQQRTGALCLKLAEVEFLRQTAGEYPILLLDDVMSELDRGRRLELLEYIRRSDIQSVITATDRAYFDGALDCIQAVYRVKNSVVSVDT
ncbi:MAG: DNA replication/repair protein RecF [Selenomonadaceae bacterium]|nr:DNA replication/repair protein RecF [Selenomonadaceae bacterium]